MTSLLRVSLFLITCFTLAITATLVNRPSIPPGALLFYRPDGTPCGAPCLLGVSHLQNMSYENIVSRLRKSPLLHSLSWYPMGSDHSRIGQWNTSIVIDANREIDVYLPAFPGMGASASEGRTVNTFFPHID
ncbi:MAG TPA: hypothetical protein VMT24_00715, partial [Aggregatilineaceae bacterium]|nr:hypothetical protein [Aggregatilineaceae bacterium]